ncbi:MAG TPA: TonB-dependent receptor plug domain-containing protein, partial [Candidatus Avacidaminococcus intestinavium]|nr:TonB-dependent receptor plug domain-containing protein [Candidatus Avacidaminococcus intestinavium]
MSKITIRRKIILALLAYSSSLCILQPTYAAESPESFNLDPMIITAQRMETRDLNTPASVSVITKEEIEKNGATTTMEALRRVAGITDYSYSPGGDDLGSSYSRVFLRGFDKGALIMVNGAPINVNNYASVSAIPINSIEKIEVVRGASSVLYGAEALGGVINIITKKGTGELKTTISSTVGNYLNRYSVTSQGEGAIIAFSKDYVNKFEHAQMDRPSNNTYRVNEKYQRTNIFTSLALSPNLHFTWNYSKIDPLYGQRKLTDGTIIKTRYAYNDTKHAASLIYTDTNNQTKTILSFNNKKVEANNIEPNGEISTGGDSSNYNVSNLYLDTQKKWNIN